MKLLNAMTMFISLTEILQLILKVCVCLFVYLLLCTLCLVFLFTLLLINRIESSVQDSSKTSKSYCWECLKQTIMNLFVYETYHVAIFVYLFLFIVQTLRSVTSRILHDDVTMAIKNMRALTNKGMSPSSLRCVVCSHKASATFGGLRKDVVIFQ